VIFITIGQSAIEGFESYHFLVRGWGDPAVNDPYILFPALDSMANLQTTLIAFREYFIYHDNDRMMPFD
jgi:hypothetical protein